MMALERDMIGMAMTNAIPVVVAPGSTKPAVGSNPLAVAIPAGKKPPFVLDMSTSVIARAKLEIARREGTSIPEGWAIDKEGKPITDPTKVLYDEGGLLPLGGTPTFGAYKGFGLGVLIEILCGVLSGSSASILRKGILETRRNAGDHFFAALRIDSFLPVEDFKKSMDEMIEALEALPKLPGVENIYVAGGYEAEIEKDRKTNGIPLHPSVVASLQELAKELGIEYDL
jgi:LDH2 family malate/lactate/ureidoglycolate dehydrogenase